MAKKTLREAINEALHLEMERDSSVIVIGEDVSGGAGGSSGQRDAAGGVFGLTKGLLPKFGEDRVIDTPISESAIIGAANGAALAGYRPVAEIMFSDFIGVCFDQILNQAAKFRYMFGGAQAPLVIRMTVGAGRSAGAQHSQIMHGLLAAIPGIKVVMPSNAYDAKGLLLEAIRDNDPVIFLEHKMLFNDATEVPDEDYTVPFGEGALVREGEHATIVAMGQMVKFAIEAANRLEKDGIFCDVIDPRTASPLDEELILESVRDTGRLVVVDEAPVRCGFASDVCRLVAHQAFHSLRAPVIPVTPPHTPVPFAPELERCYLPDADKIEQAVRSVMAN